MIAGLTQLCAAEKQSTWIAEDTLIRGHAPDVVFQPYEVHGSLVAVEEDASQKNEQLNAQPLYVEQMVGYEPSYCMDAADGFIVVG